MTTGGADEGYGPADPLQTPRFAGISTFLRLPHTTHLDGVDVAFVASRSTPA